jgi:hypothetical protein
MHLKTSNDTINIPESVYRERMDVLQQNKIRPIRAQGWRIAIKVSGRKVSWYYGVSVAGVSVR